MLQYSQGSIIIGWQLYRRHAIWAVAILIVAALFPWYVHLRNPKPAVNDAIYAAPLHKATIVGRAMTHPISKNLKTTFRLEVESINSQRYGGYLLVIIKDSSMQIRLKPGAILRIEGDLKPITRTGYGDYLRRQGMFSQLEVMNISIMRAAIETGLWYRLARSHLASPYGELRLAMVLGERASPLPEPTREAFRQSGLAHLTAASGQNLVLLLTMWFAILPVWLKRQPWHMISSLMLVWGFTAMAGAGASIVRAAIMMSIGVVMQCENIRVPTLKVLLATIAIMLLVDPHYIYDIGFQLSCVAVFGIVSITPLLTGLLHLRWPRLPQWILDWLSIPVTASLLVSPVAWSYFRTLPPYAIIANVLVAPLVAVCTWGSAVTIMAYFIFEPLGKICEITLYPILWLIVKISKIFSVP